MRAVVFEMADGERFTGYTDGSTWNGFDNVWVNATMRDAILDYLMPENVESADALRDTPRDSTGLYSLANGWATTIVEGEYP